MGEHQPQLDIICLSCSLPAQRLETVVEERLHGERFIAVVTARIFTHVSQDGQKKKSCRQQLPREWVMTMAPIEEVENTREVMKSLLAKSGGNTKILSFL